MHTDAFYEQKINLLIPKAEKIAERQVEILGQKTVKRSGVDGKDYNHCYLSEFFHQAMKQLAIEAGIRKF